MATSAAVQQDVLAKYRAAITTSEAATFTRSLVLLYGPPSAGKTTLALTASEHFKGLPNPDYDPKRPETRTFCSDLGIIQIDPGATDGFKSAGYSCHVIDVNDLIFGNAEKGIPPIPRPLSAVEMAVKLAHTIPGVRYWGLDTASTFDDYERKYLLEHEELYTTKSGNVDTKKMWDVLAAAHHEVFFLFMTLPGIKMGLAHAKAVLDDLWVKDDDKKAKEALDRKSKLAQPGDPGVTLGITGRGKDAWNRANSLQIAVATQEVPGKGIQRVLHAEYTATADMATKNRFSFLIPPKPEFNLQKLFAAIRA